MSYDYDEQIEYSETQKKWHKYYEDKQWIDTKGWCDMNGNPLPFGHDEPPKKVKPQVIITGSSNAFGLENSFRLFDRNKPYKQTKEEINSLYKPKQKQIVKNKLSFRKFLKSYFKGVLAGLAIYFLVYLVNGCKGSFLPYLEILWDYIVVLAIIYVFRILFNLLKGNLKF